MPIRVGAEIRRLDDRVFGEVVYETLRQIFAVHDEFGRFFAEKIYQRELAFRIAGARTEVSIDVTIGGFCKTYFIDLLVSGGAIFELKSVGTLAGRHRSQLMNYLYGLADTSTALKVTTLDVDFLPDFDAPCAVFSRTYFPSCNPMDQHHSPRRSIQDY